MRAPSAPMRWKALLLVVCTACGGSSSNAPDAAVDAAVDAFGQRCEGACRTTIVTAAMAATRSFDRASYGVTARASGAGLHVEAHRGGGTGCPTSTSPTPDYTLVLGNVPIPMSTAPVTSPANLLDFVGDLLGGPLGAAATTVTVTPIAADVCATCVGMPAPGDPDGFVALDLSLTFAAGTVTGHLFATHCDSLDSQE